METIAIVKIVALIANIACVLCMHYLGNRKTALFNMFAVGVVADSLLNDIP